MNKTIDAYQVVNMLHSLRLVSGEGRVACFEYFWPREQKVRSKGMALPRFPANTLFLGPFCSHPARADRNIQTGKLSMQVEIGLTELDNFPRKKKKSCQ